MGIIVLAFAFAISAHAYHLYHLGSLSVNAGSSLVELSSKAKTELNRFATTNIFRNKSEIERIITKIELDIIPKSEEYSNNYDDEYPGYSEDQIEQINSIGFIYR